MPSVSATNALLVFLERPLLRQHFAELNFRFWPVSDLWAPTGQGPAYTRRLLCH
jgi:hypothetical protein